MCSPERAGWGGAGGRGGGRGGHPTAMVQVARRALAAARLGHCLSVRGRPEAVELSLFLKGVGG